MGGLGGLGGAVPVGATFAGGAPPYKASKNTSNRFVLDLACLSGATNVPHSGGHSGGPAGCSREQGWAGWASMFQSQEVVYRETSIEDQYDRSYTEHNSTSDL
jgi:hypothetical protein